MYRILIADDQPVVCELIARFIREEFLTAKIAMAKNGEQVLSLVRNEKFDLLILDISMPIKSGISVLRQMRDEYNALPVIVISSIPIDQYGEVCIRLGASTFLPKNRLDTDLIPAVKYILSGSPILRKPRIENDFSVN